MNEEEIIKRFEALEGRISKLEGGGAIQKDSIPCATETIFEDEGDKRIVTQVVGENTEEKTQNLTLLNLLGYKKKGVEDVYSSVIKENVAMHGVPLENFATHIKKLIPQSILRKGKPGSKKATYRLTTFGEAKAKKLLAGALQNESESGS